MRCSNCLKSIHLFQSSSGLCDNCGKSIGNFDYKYCQVCSSKLGKCEDCGKDFLMGEDECFMCYEEIIDGSKIQCINCKRRVCRMCDIKSYTLLWFPFFYGEEHYCFECIKLSHESVYSWTTGIFLGAFMGVLFIYATKI